MSGIVPCAANGDPIWLVSLLPDIVPFKRKLCTLLYQCRDPTAPVFPDRTLSH